MMEKSSQHHRFSSQGFRDDAPTNNFCEIVNLYRFTLLANDSYAFLRG